MTKSDRRALLAFAKAERTGRWAPKLYWQVTLIGVPHEWNLPFRSCSNIDQAAIAESMAFEEPPRKRKQ